MQLTKEKSEKLILIEQLKADALKLGVTEVSFPEEEEKYTFGTPQKVGDVVDSGNDEDIKPNTSITISFKESDKEKTQSTTMNYRRLDLSVLEEKRGKIPESNNKQLEVTREGDFLGKLSTAISEQHNLPNTLKVEVKPDTSRTVQKLLFQGIEHFKVSPHGESLTCGGGEISLLVQTKDPNKHTFYSTIRNHPYIHDYIRDPNKSVVYLDDSEALSDKKDEFKANNYTWILKEGVTTLTPEIFTHASKDELGNFNREIFLNGSDNNQITRIEDHTFSKERFSGTITTSHLHLSGENMALTLFRNVEYIGSKALEKFTMKNDTYSSGKGLIFEKPNLVVADDAFGDASPNDFNLTGAEVASLGALLVLVGQSRYSTNLKYTPNHEAGSTRENNDTYGEVIFHNNSIYVTKEELQEHFSHTEKKRWMEKVTKIILPNNLDQYPENFLSFLNLKTAIEGGKLTIQEDAEIKEGAFKEATLGVLEFEGDEDVVHVEANSFVSANIDEIIVKNQAVKEKLALVLTNLANSPKWTIKELPTVQPGEETSESEIPSIVTSTGLEYGE